ncbi:hypothetical protein BDV96DRAFT_598177 [Lophiotrema nucula]|uniref:Uncharacterized protein n=1 Tax=Lophiotrema nucula TaxID=690887 RepID=A0A6A5ZFS3_9PLEO|nr:hypothetical protein BDV96DRAFT_598177 [Lophiotrema nucula]
MCFRGLSESLRTMENRPETRTSSEDQPTPTQSSGTRTVLSAPSHEHSPEHQGSATTSPASSRRSSSSSTHHSIWTSSHSAYSTPSTSISSASSASSSTGFFSNQEIHDALANIASMYDRGEIYGTYDLGNGRRGAISGPSSDHYDGDYDEGSEDEKD